MGMITMNYDKFIDGIEEIYATFGKKRPEDQIIQAIYKKIKNLPDSFIDFAVNHFEDEEKLPQNIGHYLFRELWPKYLERNPVMKKSEFSCCPNCIPDIPGWRKVYKQEKTGWDELIWKPVIVRCACGNALNPRHEPVYSDFELENMGYSLKFELSDEVKEKYRLQREMLRQKLEAANNKVRDSEENFATMKEEAMQKF